MSNSQKQPVAIAPAFELAACDDDRLTATEQTRRAELETVIAAGLETFVEVGRALLEIRDSRLYRDSYGTFEDYCRERWGMSRIHAHRTIEAASVAQNLLPMGNIQPESERQARPLTKLKEPEQQREAWKQAVETAPKDKDGKPKVTAKHVENTVLSLSGLKQKADEIMDRMQAERDERDAKAAEAQREQQRQLQAQIEAIPPAQLPDTEAAQFRNQQDWSRQNYMVRDLAALLNGDPEKAAQAFLDSYPWDINTFRTNFINSAKQVQVFIDLILKARG